MVNKLPKKIPVIASLAASLFLFQCSPDLQEPTPDASIVPNLSSLSKKDAVANNVAKALAEKMSDVAIRKFVKEQALERFDGSAEFLFTKAARKNVGASTGSSSQSTTGSSSLAPTNSFASHLFGSRGSQNMRMSSGGIESLVDSLQRVYPLLQISVPSLSEEVNPENWDVESQEPLVAFVGEGDSKFLIAYDSQGKIHYLSKEEAPSELVVVVSENERLKPFTKGGELATQSTQSTQGMAINTVNIIQPCLEGVEPELVTEEYNYYLTSDLNSFECYDGGGNTDPATAPTTCDRDSRNTKDNLYKVKFTDQSQFNRVSEWFDSGLDIEIVIFFGQSSGAISQVTKYASGPDRDFRDCGAFTCKPESFHINAEVVTWNKETWGDLMLYVLNEKDSGKETTQSYSFSPTYDMGNGVKTTVTHTVSVKTTDEDDPLGSSVVEYCDNTDGDGTMYTTGKINLWVNQK